MAVRELDRRPDGPDSDLDEAEAKVLTELYVRACVDAVASARTPEELRHWWLAETDRRSQYGLSKAQTNRIVTACKDRIALLDSRAKSVA